MRRSGGAVEEVQVRSAGVQSCRGAGGAVRDGGVQGEVLQ